MNYMAVMMTLCTGLLIALPVAAQWQGVFSIHNISIEGTEEVPVAYVSLSPKPATACSDPFYVAIRTGSPRGKQILANLYMAKAADRSVWINFDGECLGSRPVVSGLNLQ